MTSPCLHSEVKRLKASFLFSTQKIVRFLSREPAQHSDSDVWGSPASDHIKLLLSAPSRPLHTLLRSAGMGFCQHFTIPRSSWELLQIQVLGVCGWREEGRCAYLFCSKTSRATSPGSVVGSMYRTYTHTQVQLQHGWSLLKGLGPSSSSEALIMLTPPLCCLRPGNVNGH